MLVSVIGGGGAGANLQFIEREFFTKWGLFASFLENRGKKIILKLNLVGFKLTVQTHSGSATPGGE